MLLFSAGAAGTRVALSPASRTAVSRPAIIPLPMQENERGFALLPLPFQPGVPAQDAFPAKLRSEEHTSELQSLMRISYAVFCLKKKKHQQLLRNPYNTVHSIKQTTTIHRLKQS